MDRSGRLVHGTCGWGSPHQHLSVYPASTRSAEDRLEIFAQHFGMVEVDSMCYAIPPPKTVERWVKRTPDDFSFVVKAFGAFCASTVDVASLPRTTRDMLEEGEDETLGSAARRVSYASMSERVKADLWSHFHAAIDPLLSAGKLACVVFQFHLTFSPSPRNRAVVEALRARLRPDANFAVEFRNREWITGAAGDSTVAWCRGMNVALVAADELAHETEQPDRDQRGLPPGRRRESLPTRLDDTAAWGALVRVHRRHGGAENRILGAEEIQRWATLVRRVAPGMRGRGPVFVAWGTDHADAPLINAKALDNAAGDAFALDWAGWQKKRARARGVVGLFEKRKRAYENHNEGVGESAVREQDYHGDPRESAFRGEGGQRADEREKPSVSRKSAASEVEEAGARGTASASTIARMFARHQAPGKQT